MPGAGAPVGWRTVTTKLPALAALNLAPVLPATMTAGVHWAKSWAEAVWVNAAVRARPASRPTRGESFEWFMGKAPRIVLRGSRRGWGEARRPSNEFRPGPADWQARGG